MRCETFVKKVLPATRSLLARRMVKEMGMTQMRVASVLGLSQASISQYLSAKRGSSLIKELSSDPVIKSSLDRLTRRLLQSKVSRKERQNAFCDFCIVVAKRLMKRRRK